MAAATPTIDYFVSYCQTDRSWAEWIAWEVEQAGYSVIVQAWDFPAGTNFVLKMNQACERARRIIAVLSPDYAESLYGQSEWANAFALDPTGIKRSLIPVRVRPFQPSGLLSQIVFVDLVACSPAEAREKLLSALSDGIRSKPAQPPKFPEPSFPEGKPGGGGGEAQNPFLPLVGRVEDGARFFDRKAEMARVFEVINSGASVALLGPRGIGKSSILYALRQQAPSRLTEPRKPLYLDLQHISDDRDFFAALCELMDVQESSGFRLTRSLRDKRFLLILDEVEKMTWKGFTRGVRSQLRGLAEGTSAPLRLVLGSRSPLDTLFDDGQNHAVSPLANICMEIQVGPWPPEVVREFIELTLRPAGLSFPVEMIDAIYAESKGFPQEVMKLCHQRFNFIRGRR